MSELSSLLLNLSNPEIQTSFQEPIVKGYPKVYVFHSPTEEPEELVLDSLYPFMTVQDIKTKIYLEKGEDDLYVPASQALLIPLGENPSSSIASKYVPLDFAFVSVDKKGNVLVTHELLNPFERIQTGVDERFVTEKGDLKDIKMTDRSNMTMEDIFPQIFGSMNAVLHLFLYSDVIKGIDESLVKSSREWYGRIYPYYPDLPKDIEALSDEDFDKEYKYLVARKTYVTEAIDLMDNLDSLLKTTQLLPFKVGSIKFLRLLWKKPIQKVPDVESLFYNIPVTPLFPFLRILPSQGVPITKLHVDSPLRIPSFDPRLIPQWAQQKPPSKDDFLFGKILVRKSEGLESLYGTLRVFDDRSADFILQPPKTLKKLLLQDIELFPKYLTESLRGTYLESAEAGIGEAAIVCGIPKIGLRQIPKERFLQRLKAFSPLFQEIPPIEEKSMIAMLRYRGVSKFTQEDKVFSFISQYATKLELAGDDVDAEAGELVEAIMKTFKIRFQDAKNTLEKWIRENGKVTLAVAETKDFVLQYNRGTDIAIYADQSSYTFHLYRVQSIIHLQRILTALSLLLSGTDEDFEVGEITAFEDAASVVSDEFKEKEEERGIDDEDEDDARGDTYDALGEDIDDLEEAPKPVAKPVAKATAVPAKAETLSIREFFTKRLYDADSELFTKTEVVRKDLKEDVKGKPKQDVKQNYSSKCQSIDDRQPVVMNEDKYRAMLEEYENDNITFQEFPLRPGEKQILTGTIVPVLVYGSLPSLMNYYICCEYFCLKDVIMVLEEDFKGTSYRPKREVDGVEVKKEPNSCPFCGGTLINKKNQEPGQTVYRRRADKGNKHIGLLLKTNHPQGIFQPCCFSKMPNYSTRDPQFRHLEYRPRTTELKEPEEKDEDVGSVSEPLKYTYSLVLASAYTKYIVRDNKFPLVVSQKGGPQIGVLLPILDSYFQQDNSKIIYVSTQKHELFPDSKAFLRLGVDNTTQSKPESFFTAVAPYFLNLNTAEDLRRALINKIIPMNFIFFNYGNLVMEFYNPSDKGPTDTDLQLWSQKNFDAGVTSNNKEALLRIWKSYHRFLRFLEDPKTLKEYRQFAQMLALPNFMSTNGIIFIVLDIVKQGEVEVLKVRCPPFGYDSLQYGDCDIAFIIHHHTGYWEPIFYSENQRSKGRFADKNEVHITFQRALFSSWPPIVQKRVFEFTQKCAGSGRAAWTSGSEVDSFALIPVERAIQGMGPSPEGVIRDAYNHVVGLTFREGGGKSKLIALPVADDGTILTLSRVHFDWDDYTPASLESVVNFYKEEVEPRFGYYPGYSVATAVLEVNTNKFVAVRLKNGLYIPCAPVKAEDPAIQALLKSLPFSQIEKIEDMEWMINRDIIFGKKGREEEREMYRTTENLVSEAFEYLRLTFSNWFSSEKVSGELRERVERILFTKDLPLFEKRKRLEILLGDTVRSWMDTEEEFTDVKKTLLRVDCLLQTGPDCPAQCVWKESKGKCLIHTPGSTETFENIPLMLSRRLFEELIRFPEKRQQLLEKNVSPLVSLKQAILMKDQYIVPQSSLAWYDLLRAEWLSPTQEKKKFYEEMSSVKEDPDVLPVVEKESTLPELLQNIIGDETLAKSYYLYRPQSTEYESGYVLPFLVSLGKYPDDIGLEDDAFELTEEAMRKLVLLIRRPVMQIDLTGGDIQWKIYGPAKKQKDPNPFILVIQDSDLGGPAMLSLSPTTPVPIPYDKLSSDLQFLLKEDMVLVS